MSDLIDRQKAIEAIQTINSEGDSIINSVLGIIELKIIDLPSAEPRMKGKWIPHYDEVVLFDGMSIGGMACSVCGWKTHNKMHLFFGCPYKYCPNCGARMSEGEEDD